LSISSLHALTQSLAAAALTAALGFEVTSAQAAFIDYGSANSAAAEAAAPDAARGAGNLAIAWTWNDGGDNRRGRHGGSLLKAKAQSQALQESRSRAISVKPEELTLRPDAASRAQGRSTAAG
jgi:hypothetical protein